MVFALAAVLLSVPAAAATSLAPDPQPPPASETAAVAPDAPADPGGTPHGPAAALIGLGGAALAAGATSAGRRRAGGTEAAAPADALGLLPPADALVVFVPGHGNGPEVFDDLIASMGLDAEQVRIFDYRLATDDADAAVASARASIDDAADALNGYLSGLAESGRPIYLVGFSKGGATAARTVARWDAGGAGAADAVSGVVLLDPPLADGIHGWLQSLGRYSDEFPDDGGYDPVSCTFLTFGCDDERDFLGWESGVDTLVIRNPKAGVTSFGDTPDGLRIYDAPDPGPAPRSLWWRPWLLPGRISDAHEAVLHDDAVAGCLLAEMRTPGTCALEPASPAARLGAAARAGLAAVRRFLDALAGR